jgi:hypothetical protein
VHEARVLRETAQRTKVVTQMGEPGALEPRGRAHQHVDPRRGDRPVRAVHAWTNRPIWPQGIPRPQATAGGAPQMPFGNPYTMRSLAEQLAAAMQISGSATPSPVNWDLYLGPAAEVPFHPVYHPFNWRGFTAFGVGALGDMGAHLIDHPYWALELGYPSHVEATSTPWGGDEADPATYPQAMLVHYDFPARGARPPVRLTWYDGGLMPERPPQLPDAVALDRTGGVIMVGEKGILMHETYGARPRIYPESLFQQVAPDYVQELERAGREERVRKERGAAAGPPRQLPSTPTVTHEMQWAAAIKDGTPASSPFSYAGPLTETMLLGIVALRTGQGRTIAWDGARGEVTNVPEANQHLRRAYRAGWSL